MIRRSEKPESRAASMNSRLTRPSVAPRTERAKKGMLTTAMARSAFIRPGPRAATMAKRQQQIGKGHQHVDAAHQHVVGDAAEIGGNQADRAADQRRHQGRGDADGDADPGSPDQAREHVAAELVGAEPRTLAEGRQQPVGGLR